MSERDETRERVRALVKQVLENVPLDEEKTSPETFPKRIVVNSLKDEIGREFDRDESAKSLLTEDDLRGLEAGAKLRVSENARFTPLADDIIREKQIQLIKKSERRGSSQIQSIAVGADHGGFPFKEQLKDFLESSGFRVYDFGTNSQDAVDYPDFAHAVAKAVGEKQADVGIVIDGAGIGSAMTANKVPNVRAAACYSVQLAKNSREQNTFGEIKEIVEAWLSTDLTEQRHQKRVAKIDAVERQYQR